MRGQLAPIVSFSNNDLFYGINAPFYEEDGTTRLAGTNYRAALYYGLPGSPPASFQRSTADSQPFGTGAGAGYWRSSQIRVPVPGPVPSSQIGLQVRFWDSENGTLLDYGQAERDGGRVGVSAPIVITIDPTPSAVNPMIGLQSASLVPTITLTRGVPNLITKSGFSSGAQLTTLCGVSIGPNRWFRLTSPYAGDALLTTAGSEMDTVMGAFGGSIVSPSTLVPITCNDDFNASVTSSHVRFPVEANTLYLLCVGGKNGATNTVRLSHTLATELQIRRRELNRIELSWPVDATNCMPEAAAGLQGIWRTITNAPVTVTNRKVLNLESGTSDETVYRLRLSPTP